MTGLTSQATSGLLSRADLAAHLEDEILAGRLGAGTKLPSERQLADRFGVSRPVVREALRGLVERDLVEVRPGRGTYVRHARSTDAADRLGALYRRHQATPRHLVEARTMLESTAAALAAERATQEQVAAIERALVRFDSATGLIDQARFDLGFHLAIARAAGNPVIETMFGSITGLSVELMLRSLGDPAVARTAVPLHWAILDAIRHRDAERARAEMVGHLSVAASLYGDDYDRNLESVAQRELERLLAPSVTLDDLLAATTPNGGEDGRDGRG